MTPSRNSDAPQTIPELAIYLAGLDEKFERLAKAVESMVSQQVFEIVQKHNDERFEKNEARQTAAETRLSEFEDKLTNSRRYAWSTVIAIAAIVIAAVSIIIGH